MTDDFDDMEDLIEACEDPASNWPWIAALLLWWLI